MSYQSVDALQKILAEKVFHYATDRKKASGRALGTLVELVTFYTLRAWDLRDYLAIERSIPEFANPEVVHNVEFSLHPIQSRHAVIVAPAALPLTSSKIIRSARGLPTDQQAKPQSILTQDRVLRNACVIADTSVGSIIANVDSLEGKACQLTVCHLLREPFAVFECKRVGVEEGMRKGPQTIEKAKQGAYVARTVSALQKVRLRNGRFQGVLERADGSLYVKPYELLLRETIDGNEPDLLREFILTVGVVSNHGNWFTSNNPNKELLVLAQSYDWLLFLTDEGLAQFIEKLLLRPAPELAPAREAFLTSYSGKAGANRFTKVRIGLEADAVLRQYFAAHEVEVEGWFNVISPRKGSLNRLREDVRKLAGKDWARIRKK